MERPSSADRHLLLSPHPIPPPPSFLSDSNVKAIIHEWEDFEEERASLVSLSSALDDAKRKKMVLQRKLEFLTKVRTKVLRRLNELVGMREKMESQKVLMQKNALRVKATSDNAKRMEEIVITEVRSLLVAGTALSVSRKQLKESNRLFTGSKDYCRLRNVQKLLRLRQQYMVSQVSSLYPIKITVGHAQEQEHESFPSTSRSGNFRGSKPVNHGSLTILGLQMTMVPFTKLSFFTDKHQVQQSATALGYVGHSLTLLASCLKVPLGYPFWLGGSCSYILDLAPSIETATGETSACTASPSDYGVFGKDGKE